MHAYYYQVQTQLHVCDVEFCDFVLCTFPETGEEMCMHVERITKDEAIWAEWLQKATHFFQVCILPELLGKWYTRPSKMTPNEEKTGPTTSSITQQTFYYCKGPSEGDMIACDNPTCEIEWFHFACLKMTTTPKGKRKWYCPDCRLLPEFNKAKQLLSIEWNN